MDDLQQKTTLTHILDRVHAVLKVLLGILIAALLVPVTMQILSRYTGIIPRYIWTEEIARFSFVWIIMLGAICAVRDGSHFDLDVLPETGNRRFEVARKLFVHIVIAVVGGFFVVYGIKFVQFGWHQTSEIFELPMPWIFVSWPIAGALFIVFSLEKMHLILHQNRQAGR